MKVGHLLCQIIRRGGGEGKMSWPFRCKGEGTINPSGPSPRSTIILGFTPGSKDLLFGQVMINVTEHLKGQYCEGILRTNCEVQSYFRIEGNKSKLTKGEKC